jgi:hypothetical protein
MSGYEASQQSVPVFTGNLSNKSPVKLPNEPHARPKNIYINDEENTDNTNIIISYKDYTGKYIYMIFHIIMAFVAVFLSWKCNGGKFDLLTFLIALFFPYIYIIFILATRGTCDRL